MEEFLTSKILSNLAKDCLVEVDLPFVYLKLGMSFAQQAGPKTSTCFIIEVIYYSVSTCLGPGSGWGQRLARSTLVLLPVSFSVKVLCTPS